MVVKRGGSRVVYHYRATPRQENRLCWLHYTCVKHRALSSRLWDLILSNQSFDLVEHRCEDRRGSAMAPGVSARNFTRPFNTPYYTQLNPTHREGKGLKALQRPCLRGPGNLDQAGF